MSKLTYSIRDALTQAIGARNQFREMDEAAHVVSDPDAYLALSHAASKAIDRLRQALLYSKPSETFFQGVGDDGRILTVGASSKEADKWQLTRFDGSAEPWGDSVFISQRDALGVFLREVDISSIKDSQGIALLDRHIPDQSDEKTPITSIPEGLVSIGYQLLPRGNPRRFAGFGTWEKNGVRIALSGNKLLTDELGNVIVYGGDGDEMTIEAIITDEEERGLGRASAALQDVITFADQLKLRLHLEVAPLEKRVDRSRLTGLYERLGFKSDQAGKVLTRQFESHPEHSEAFIRWSKGAKVIPANASATYTGGPVVFEAYHGTTHSNITSFKSSAGSAENALGKGIYATTTVEDASLNYAGVGPDLTRRISDSEETWSASFYDEPHQATEMLEEYFEAQGLDIEVTDEDFDELSDEYGEAAIHHRAVTTTKGNSDGLVMPVYIRFSKPFDIRPGGLILTRQDDPGDQRRESGAAIELRTALRIIADIWNIDAQELIDFISEEDGDGVSAFDVWEYAQKNLRIYFNLDGDPAGVGQFMQEVAREAGYDGIIQDADTHFGAGRRGFGGVPVKMQGIKNDTLHLMPFEGNQVKSALGNSGEFSVDNDDIRFSDAPKGAITDLPAFKEWFGESKVYGSNGLPMVMYHASNVGTNPRNGESLGDFAEFDRLATKRVFGRESIDQVGSWFTNNPGEGGAAMYGGTVVYPVYLSINRPYTTTFERMRRRAQALSGQDLDAQPNTKSVDALREWMKEMGMDGIHIQHDDYASNGSTEFKDQDVWIALEPDQIKSAIAITEFQKAQSIEAPQIDKVQRKVEAELKELAMQKINVQMERNSVAIERAALASQQGNVSTTDSPAFKGWFDGSVVTDGSGNPLVVYHGTDANVHVFSKAFAGKNVNHPATKVGFFFTDNAVVANNYAVGADLKRYNSGDETGKQQIIPAYLSIKHPQVFTVKSADEGDALIASENLDGYDGVVLHIRSDNGASANYYVAFDPVQIKSATENNGQFDASNDDIRFSEVKTPVATDSAEFKKWFGDSQIIGGDGKPLVVYRGEGSQSERNIYSLVDTRENAIFMTPDKEIARIYERGNEPRAFYVHAPKLIDLTEDTKATRAFITEWAAFYDEWIDRQSGEPIDPVEVVLGGRLFDYEGDWSGERWKSLQAEALSNHDAAYLPDWDNEKGMFKALAIGSTASIKSATENNGQFDLNNHDIRFSEVKAPDRTDSPEFKKWFGDSRIIGGDGKPMVMYHGTPNEFGVFRESKRGGPFFFTPDSKFAAHWAEENADGIDYSSGEDDAVGPSVIPVFLSVKDPFDPRSPQSIDRLVRTISPSQESEAALRTNLARGEYEFLEEYIEKIKDAGFDGFYEREDASETIWNVGVFTPAQIKSAIGNNGEFDSANPDIRFSEAKTSELTDLPEFKRWFGDSKVLDVDGEPLVMYHGTTSSFDTFKENQRGVHFVSPSKTWVSKFHQNDDGTVADGANTMPVFVAARNPFDYENKKHVDSLATAASLGRAAISQIKKGLWARIEDRTTLDAIKRLGFDGVYVNEEGHKNLAVFSSGQIKSAIGNSGEFDGTNSDIRYSERASKPFYSALSQEVAKLKMQTAPVVGWRDAIKGLINKGQVKAEEIEWTGLGNWLELQTGKITKEQVQQYLDANGVQVKEMTLVEHISGIPDGWVVVQDRYGNWQVVNQMGIPVTTPQRSRDAAVSAMPASSMAAKFAKYVIPGGENYREVLLTLPSASSGKVIQSPDGKWRIIDGNGVVATRAYWSREDAMGNTQNVGAAYRSSHWDQTNVLAHLRLDDRTDTDGNRVLFVQEVQSDWGQDGKKKGFDTPVDTTGFSAKEVERYGEQYWKVNDATGGHFFSLPADGVISEADAIRSAAQRAPKHAGAVPVAPFVTTTNAWLNLALKRVIKMAVDGGYDKVAFANGEQSAAHYDLSKQVKRIAWKPSPDDKPGVTRVNVNMWDPQSSFMLWVDGNGNVGDRKDGLSGKNIEDILGKEVAKRIATEPSGELADADLKIGGEGMMTFYDRIVPIAAGKLSAKLGGGKIESIKLTSLESNGVSTTREVKREQPGITITDRMRELAAGGLPLFSFAGQKAAIANNPFQADAEKRIEAGEDRETVRRETGWFIGSDEQWRFEISDDKATLKPAIKSLARGGYESKRIVSIVHKANGDGTYDVVMRPPNPQKTTDFVSLKHVSRDVLHAVLPDDLYARVRADQGEPDYIGDFEDAKCIEEEFDFGGFNALPLDQVIDHPTLFAAYPQLRDISVQVDPRLGISASYVLMEDDTKVIRVGLGQQLKSILHEIQHGIQDIEGFAPGGSPHAVLDEQAQFIRSERIAPIQLEYQSAKSAYREDKSEENWIRYEAAANAFQAISPKPNEADKLEYYRRLAGEVEARNTQSRIAMDPYERNSTSPSATADVADKDVIVSKRRQPAMASISSMRQAIAGVLGNSPESLKQGTGGVVILNSRQIDSHWTPIVNSDVRMSETGVELSPRIIAAASRSTAQAFYDPRSGTCYFLSDRILAGTESAVFLHEITHKYGKAELGSRWQSLVGCVKDWSGHAAGTNERKIFDVANSRAIAAGRTDVYDEELFAYAVEEAVTLGIKPSAQALEHSAEKWLDTVIRSIEQVTSKLTGKNKSALTAQEIVDLSYALAQLETPAHANKVRQAFKQYLSQDPVLTPAFKAWFKDSRVVDANYKPAVVYHGTGQGFDSFKGGKMIWASTDPVLANEYAFGFESSVVMPLYMRAVNPFVVGNENQSLTIRTLLIQALNQAEANGNAMDTDAAKSLYEVTLKEWERLNFTEACPIHHHWALSGITGYYLLRDYFKAIGFDSIELTEGGVRTFGVFDPRAVKSASANNGQFDGEDTRLSFSKKAPAPTFYSALLRAIESTKAKSMTGPDWMNLITGFVNKGSVKRDEVEWSGLAEWISMADGKITKEQVQDFVRVNGVQIQERVLRDSSKETTGYEIVTRLGKVMVHTDTEDEAIRILENMDDSQQSQQCCIREVSEESTKSTAVQYDDYQLPGGENYREILLLLPNNEDSLREKMKKKYPQWVGLTSYLDVMSATDAQALTDARNGRYSGSHWKGQSNVLAHVRLNERLDAQGKRVLFVEEIQSDWAQNGKKLGFKDGSKRFANSTTHADAGYWEVKDQHGRFLTNVMDYEAPDATEQSILAIANERLARGAVHQIASDNRPPPGPFVGKTDAWVGLAIKRIVSLAVEEGFDSVAFINGEQSSDRYKLSKKLSRVEVERGHNDFFQIDAFDHKDEQIIFGKTACSETLPGIIGKDLAKHVIDLDPGNHTISGLDLDLGGGEGMKSFYNTIVPNVVKDVLHKLGGAKLHDIAVNTEGNGKYRVWLPDIEDFHNREFVDPREAKTFADYVKGEVREDKRTTNQTGFDITDGMRERVFGGVPLFSLARESEENNEPIAQQKMRA